MKVVALVWQRADVCVFVCLQQTEGGRQGPPSVSGGLGLGSHHPQRLHGGAVLRSVRADEVSRLRLVIVALLFFFGSFIRKAQTFCSQLAVLTSCAVLRHFEVIEQFFLSVQCDTIHLLVLGQENKFFKRHDEIKVNCLGRDGILRDACNTTASDAEKVVTHFEMILNNASGLKF